MIESQNTTLFIEPIKTQNNTTTTTSSQSSTTTATHRKHLVYRSTDVKHKSKPVVDRAEKEPAIGKRKLYLNQKYFYQLVDFCKRNRFAFHYPGMSLAI